MKFFNTAGVINPTKHYFLPRRLDWNLLTSFIEKEYYFLLHAPRQSGKTTAIIEFVKHLNLKNDYTALYLTTEPAHIAANNIEKATYSLLSEFKRAIQRDLNVDEKIVVYLQSLIAQNPTPADGISSFLTFFAETNSKPLVIFLDEFDGLMGDSLISILKQIRTGYTNRPKHFPQSMCLIGVRDLRDYRTKTKTHEELGVLYSPFNIKAESLLLPNFSKEDVKNLYLQHTLETGQQFTQEATDYAFHLTQGQPWLVNALAYQACFRDVQDRSQPITKEVIDRAKEALIERRDTHIDALTDRLKEKRVLRIIDSIISGGSGPVNLSIDDLQYVRDLGLITQRGFAIANPIYQEIIPRALVYTKQHKKQTATHCY